MLNYVRQSIRMETVARSVVALPKDVNPCEMGCVQSSGHSWPVISGSYNYSRGFYELLTERYTPNSKGPHVWKDFEHRKAFRSEGREVSVPFYMRAYEFEPHVWAGKKGVVSNRYPCEGYAPASVTGVRPFGEPALPLQGLASFEVEREDGGFIPAPSNLDDLIAKSLRTMLPTIKAELSLINSIVELKDFGSLPRTLRGLYSLAVPAGQTLRRFLHAAADGYLQYSFNLAPLFSDILGIHKALETVEQRIRSLVNGQGQPQRKHFAYKWVEYQDSFDVSDGYYGFSSAEIPLSFIQYTGYRLERDCRYNPSVFHAEIDYNYSFSRFQTEHAQLLGLLDALGVNLNPAIIWNAIPWSFVIDWVLGVSRWLNDRRILNMEPQINIRNYLWSIKRERNVSLRCQPFRVDTSDASVPPTYSAVQLPPVYESSYRRKVGIPAVSSIISSGLSASEFSLGAALWVTRRRRSHRVR